MSSYQNPAELLMKGKGDKPWAENSTRGRQTLSYVICWLVGLHQNAHLNCFSFLPNDEYQRSAALSLLTRHGIGVFTFTSWRGSRATCKEYFEVWKWTNQVKFTICLSDFQHLENRHLYLTSSAIDWWRRHPLLFFVCILHPGWHESPITKYNDTYR